MKGLIWLLTCLLFIVYGLIAVRLWPGSEILFVFNQPLAVAELPTDRHPEPVESKPIRLALVGDIMMDRGVRQIIESHGNGDPGYITKYLNFLNDFDLVFGNLEGPVSDQGQDLGNLYSFRMDPDILPALTEANFSVLSIANNHAGDWGRAAFEDTLEQLTEVDIAVAGGGRNLDQALTPAIVEIKGTAFGFLGFTDLGPRWLEAEVDQAGLLWAEGEYHDEAIKSAAEVVDILVVSYHYGDEYQSEPNRRQQEISRRAIDLGADIVAGHHPHVIQPVELYQDGVIVYSLGNFIFDQYFSTETMEGLVLVVEIEDGELTVDTLEVELTDHYQPQLRNGLRYPELTRNYSE